MFFVLLLTLPIFLFKPIITLSSLKAEKFKYDIPKIATLCLIMSNFSQTNIDNCRRVKIHSRTDNFYRKHESLPDEIDLRDEILELKRQLMVLKRENEQQLVKLKRYEDEAKRRDQQLEELMDPRKNADITKVLSTKGAVILMNLKDQNNALIQMILNKNLHIRRLMTELKATKLYASTGKNEFYRAEINRLKNLLMKMEQSLKDSSDEQQGRSICAEENSLLELSSFSSQSTPRDLDELRQTISSLESQIKHSNDLLIKKNQEISLLADKVNFLRKFYCHKTSNKKVFDSCQTELREKEIITSLTCSKQGNPNQMEMSNQVILDFFEKSTYQSDQGQPHPDSTQSLSPVDSIRKYDFQSQVTKGMEHRNDSFIIKNEKQFEKVTEIVSVVEKSLFQNLANTELKTEEKINQRFKKPLRTQEKWKNALEKHRKLEKSQLKIVAHQEEVKEACTQYENGNKFGFLEKNEESHELKKMIKRAPGCQILEKKNLKSDIITEKLDSLESPQESQKLNTPLSDIATETTEISQSHQLPDEDYHKVKLLLQNDAKKEITTIENSPKSQRSFFKTIQNVSNLNKIESEKCFGEINLHSFHSSSDSEYSYTLKQEVQQVQVEDKINSLSFQSDNDQFENNQILEHNEQCGGNSAPDLDFNDDDDIIVREK